MNLDDLRACANVAVAVGLLVNALLGLHAVQRIYRRRMSEVGSDTVSRFAIIVACCVMSLLTTATPAVAAFMLIARR